jgi:cytidylate kinase
MITFFKWLFVSFSNVKTALLNTLKKIKSLYQINLKKVYQITKKLLSVITHRLIYFILINDYSIYDIIANSMNSEMMPKHSLAEILLALLIHLVYLF